MRRIIYISLLFVVVLVTATSCKKWLDVQPKTMIKSADLLKTEQGYKDALVGVYTMLTPESLYGRELSFGFFDALTRSYESTSTVYQPLVNWWQTPYSAGYTLTTVKPRIDGFWNGLYNAIANVNNILDHIDADQKIFTGDNYSIVKGEALALRGFLHLELFRMFAANPATDLANSTNPAIPYETTLSTKITKSSSGVVVDSLIITDLKNAATLLQVDPIKTKGQKKSADPFLNDRNLRLNYYAVKGLLARAYLWNPTPDYTNALAAAQEVMEAGDQLFPWVLPQNISNSDVKNVDFSFSTEHLFALHVPNLQTIANTWFISAAPNNQLCKQGTSGTTYYYDGLFENKPSGIGATDYRLVVQSDPNIVPFNVASNVNYYTLKKYYQPAGYNPNYANRIPLIRRSEMNYIAAECILMAQPANLSTAIGYLNTVRQNRGISVDLLPTLTPAQVRTEITKEYWKEFQGEGQLFFYCKRTNSLIPSSVNAAGTMSYLSAGQFPAAIWTLPKPDNEKTYNP